jgi:hypothetical protein
MTRKIGVIAVLCFAVRLLTTAVEQATPIFVRCTVRTVRIGTLVLQSFLPTPTFLFVIWPCWKLADGLFEASIENWKLKIFAVLLWKENLADIAIAIQLNADSWSETRTTEVALRRQFVWPVPGWKERDDKWCLCVFCVIQWRRTN